MKRWHQNVKCCRRPHAKSFFCFTHKSTCTKVLVSALLGLGKRHDHSPHQTCHQKVRQRGRQTWYQKRAPESAPKSAPKSVLKNQIQSAKTWFLRGAKDECRRHGFRTSRTPWSALFGRNLESTFRRIVRRACGRINRKDQPTANKQQTTCR